MHINCIYCWGIHRKLTFCFSIFAQFTTHFNVEFLFKLQVKYFCFFLIRISYFLHQHHSPLSYTPTHSNTVCLALERAHSRWPRSICIKLILFSNWINKCCHSTLHNKPHCLLRSFPRAWNNCKFTLSLRTREWKSKQSHSIRHIITPTPTHFMLAYASIYAQ